MLNMSLYVVLNVSGRWGSSPTASAALLVEKQDQVQTCLYGLLQDFFLLEWRFLVYPIICYQSLSTTAINHGVQLFPYLQMHTTRHKSMYRTSCTISYTIEPQFFLLSVTGPCHCPSTLAPIVYIVPLPF